MAAFVLVNAYSSTLTSFVSAPNRQLLISTMDEVLIKPFVKVVVVKGKGTDVFISVRKFYATREIMLSSLLKCRTRMQISINT